MNLAIEYVKRTGCLRPTIPCSLFLEGDNKLVVTLTNCYRLPDKVSVKHWKLWQTTQDMLLPPFDEFVIDRDKVMTSEYVVVDGYKLIDYEEQPYVVGDRQHTDPHLGYLQQKEYCDCVDKIYNSDRHKARREMWLLRAFSAVYVEGSSRNWVCWRKHLLDFKGYAAELIFNKRYKYSYGEAI